MRNFMTALCVLAMPVMAVAQIHYPDSKNPDILRHMERVEPYRQEMILPQVNGYNVYKADLHTHTLFSDGSVMPEFRVQEAWEDGLDILAITDHIESRKSEEIFVEYLQKYVSDEYPKALNTFIALEPTPKGSIDSVDTISDPAALQGILMSGKYMRPFEVNFSVSYKF
ncbi:MAG: hypothetical protein IJV84_08005 [Bacteroidales bacterium]|nr:hypothetical protein [Bacteroidales bacterium]